ncbi:MAG: type II secretion system F family protein, partial [Candidatus Omnitrophica bacterium]|nr:type II secretion system F family protein [Candidatus Omnitrophota bacterium]
RKHANPTKLETIIVEAGDVEGLIQKLHKQDFFLVSSEEIATPGSQVKFFGKKFKFFKTAQETKVGSHKKGKETSGVHLFPHVSSRELITFATQLSALLKGGVPLLKSLQIAEQGMQNHYFKLVLKTCIEHVSSGFALSHAIGEFQKVFPSIWGNLVAVGEASGNLPSVLEEIAHYQESSERVKSKVISAFLYPSILILFATVAVTFILLFIIPKFEEMFQGMGAQLPFLTRWVVFASQTIRNHFLIVVLLVFAGVFGIHFARRKREGRFFFDFLSLKLPIMGVLVLQVSIIRFTRGLGTLIRSGVPILQSLEISTRIVQNVVVQETLKETREAVKTGRGLGKELELAGLFPPFMTQLISVGEETGELERFLKLISDYYEERLDTFLSRLSTLLEPILLVCVGSIIGVIVVSMFLPIVELSTGAVGVG